MSIGYSVRVRQVLASGSVMTNQGLMDHASVLGGCFGSQYHPSIRRGLSPRRGKAYPTGMGNLIPRLRGLSPAAIWYAFKRKDILSPGGVLWNKLSHTSW
jgi:hypothetical protein